MVLKKLKRFPSSVLFLIAANAVPLYGISCKNWHIFDIILLYWAESVIVAFFVITKIMTARYSEDMPIWLHVIIRVFVVSIFCIGFGGAMYGYFVALQAIITMVLRAPFNIVDKALTVWPALLSFFISHGYSYTMNYLVKGERRTADMKALALRPIPRIAAIHLVLCMGAAPALVLGKPVIIATLFIGFKIIADLFGHLWERRKSSISVQLWEHGTFFSTLWNRSQSQEGRGKARST